ncbi:MAG: glycoside hydrolase family 97 catalytic domain-containing protein [Acidobacteria bacterium]|nr:glycoside hydrolase family 97 catalytic domain-containing protein [Acidobacteriota bacterium]
MRTLFLLLAWLVAVPVHAQEWSATSPDGRTTITLALRDGGRLSWRVAHAGSNVLADSPLGIRRADQSFAEGLKLVAARDAVAIDERYQTPHGKRRDHHVRGRERTLAFANASSARLEIILRAHDDGVAFRYRFPESDANAKKVIEEQTGFRVPAGSTGWLLAHQDPEKYGPAYEDFFREVAVGAAAPRAAGWSFPALFKTAGGQWLLISESGLDGTYCGSHLAGDASGGVYRLAFPDPREGLGVGEVQPSSTLPWATPWRVVIVGDAAGRILESDLVSDLSPPSRMKDTSWVKPGRASWSWWSASNSPKHAQELNAFTDLAAEMSWEYALVDANWNQMLSGTIEDVLAHAKRKGVGLLFWYNSGGPHNDVTEAPRDRMHTRDVRRAELAKLKAWGVKGVKVDFWHSDKQDRIRQYRDILEDAADFGLLVNFHGCTMTRGWSREFPHLVSMEAVFGAEQYKYREAYATRAPSHNTILPFTRNVVGPMDYTPVTFSDVKFPHKTTSAHELAQSVVFESGVQHFADSVQSYLGLPEAPKAFLKQVPAAWDETRALAGDPGKLVIVARRAKDVWYVGGLSGQESPDTYRAALGFLGAGSWSLMIIADGDPSTSLRAGQDRTFQSSTRTVTSRDTIDVTMRPRGGFVMRLTKTGARD